MPELRSNKGIFYAFDEQTANELGYKKFQYTSSNGIDFDNKNQEEYKNHVYCKNHNQFLNLVAEWNSQIGNWLYKEFEEKNITISKKELKQKIKIVEKILKEYGSTESDFKLERIHHQGYLSALNEILDGD